MLTEQERRALLDIARFQPYYCVDGRPIFPPYVLSNLGANIRRLALRLGHIEAARKEQA